MPSSSGLFRWRKKARRRVTSNRLASSPVHRETSGRPPEDFLLKVYTCKDSSSMEDRGAPPVTYSCPSHHLHNIAVPFSLPKCTKMHRSGEMPQTPRPSQDHNAVSCLKTLGMPVYAPQTYFLRYGRFPDPPVCFYATDFD